jgi:hypothetical protein
MNWTWPVLLLALPCIAAAEDRLWLVREGKGCAAIVAGAEDHYAASRLQRGIFEASGVQLPLVAPTDATPAGDGCLIALGSTGSNPWVGRLGTAAGADLTTAGLTEQGYVAKRVPYEGRSWLLLAGGGADGVRYAVVDLLNWHVERTRDGVWLGPLNTRQVPRFRYRWFWNWDHRMDWGGAGRVGNVMGGGTYGKTPEAFTTDCHRCIDFMADHKFNGLILWGFLRDSHGGLSATQEVCRYAAQRGVRILPGVGTSDYGGCYFQGRHEFNVDTYLAAHPERRAIGPNGKPRNAICPSQKVNQDWLDRGAEWLLANFEVGGVNLEMGDFYVCYCQGCKRSRAAIHSDEPDYYKDMAISHMVTLRKLRALKPDAWLSYATYTGYTPEMMRQPPQFLAMIPPDALCQWTLTDMAPRWRPEVRPMAQHNVGYLHWCNSSTNTENDFYLAEIRAICQQAAGVGFEGLDTYGELSDRWPNAEIFYLAWEAFLWQPELTIDQFVDQRLGRLYGGPAAARRLLEIMPLVRNKTQREQGDHCLRALALARSARGAASADGQPRWDRLIEFLERQAAAVEQVHQKRLAQERAARAGRKIPVAAVKASDQDSRRGWSAQRAVDGDVAEPAGYWLTQRNNPSHAWLEVSLGAPSRVNRVVLFHQLDAGHYRSLDYTVSVRVGGKWKPVLAVRDNQQSGWVAHPIAEVVADAARLEITRSAYGARMGVGEFELRCVDAPRASAWAKEPYQNFSPLTPNPSPARGEGSVETASKR